MDELVIGLVVAVATLAVVAVMAGLGGLALLNRVRALENDMLGVQYDNGLHAIALDDAGIPIHNDTRELADHARRGQPADTPPNAVYERWGEDRTGPLDANG
jgi:hypothetical protein